MVRDNVIKITVLLLFSLCCVYQSTTYSGSILIFAFFSISFFILISSLIGKWNGYFYTFCAIFMLLGFWLKFFWHSVTGLAYVEPTGYFNFTGESWNEVLFVASAGTISLLTAKYAHGFIGWKDKYLQLAPVFHLNNYWRQLIVIGFVLIIILIFCNLYYGVAIIGIDPNEVKLLWPFNALITLMIIGGGLPLIISAIAWIFISNKGSVFTAALLVIMVGFFLNLTTLSRAMLVTTVIPIFLAIYNTKTLYLKLANHRKAILIGFFLSSLFLSFFIVNQIRDNIYYKNQFTAEKKWNKNFLGKENFLGKLDVFFRFAIDRWTGLEGVMAVVAYDKKSISFFKKAMLDTPVNKPSLYEKICPWPQHLQTNLKKGIRNFSIPGILAFLYYSDSILFVVIGVFCLVFIGMLAEIIIYRLVRDPFFTATFGWILAFNLIMFSGVPRFYFPLIEFLFLMFLTYLILLKVNKTLIEYKS